jgi:hypothetical protein
MAYGIEKDSSRKDAKGAKTKPNTKLEIRNSKQIQMVKKQKISNTLISDFYFWISDLTASFV